MQSMSNITPEQFYLISYHPTREILKITEESGDIGMKSLMKKVNSRIDSAEKMCECEYSGNVQSLLEHGLLTYRSERLSINRSGMKRMGMKSYL